MPRLTSDFSATEPGAIGNYTIDFLGNLPPNATLQSVAWALTVQRTLPGFSVDPAPTGRLVGASSVNGTASIQRIGGLVAGNDYIVAATGAMTNGEAVVLWGILSCRGAGFSAAAVDQNDPCARAASLRAAYDALLSGRQEVEIRTRTLDAEELVRFTAANLDALRTEMNAAMAACAVATGAPNPNRRYAITAGSTRRWGFPGATGRRCF